MNSTHVLFFDNYWVIDSRVNEYCKLRNLNPISISVCQSRNGSYIVTFITEDLDKKGASE